MNSQVAHMSTANSQSDLPGILSKEAQRKLFRRARRHTYFVKILKVMLPLACIGISGLYFIPNKKTLFEKEIGEGIATVDNLDLSSEGLKMINPNYTGHHEKLGSYKIGAEYALQNLSNPERLNMHKITGLITHPDKKWTKVKAAKGLYDTKTEEMKLDGKIHITSNRGMEAELEGADVDVKKQKIVTDNPLTMRLDSNTISASKMTLSTAKKHILFEGNVKMRLYKKQSGAAASLLSGN